MSYTSRRKEREERKKLPKWAAKKSNDSFFRFPLTLYNSPAWRALTANQMNLYLFSTWHRLNNKQHPRNDYPDHEQYQSDEVFYMNLALVVKNGLYTLKNRHFYRDCKRLIDIGFWDEVSNGKDNFSKNVYRMSERWKDWKPDIEK